MRTASFLSRILLLALPLTATAEGRLAGYIKSFAVGMDEPDITGVETHPVFQSQNSGRVMWDYFGDDKVWQVHYELGAVFSSREPDFPTATTSQANAWRITDPDNELNDDPRVSQNLDRFNVQFNYQAGDLTVGRQAITFGMARIINPTDVFLPYDVRTLNTEYRFGVDAVRFQKPYGQLGELDFGVILGEDADPDYSAAFFQMRDNMKGTDYQLTLMGFANQGLVGGGLQSSIGDMGFWLEVAGTFGDDEFARLSTGLDHAFSEDVFGMVEYHYNGAGEADPTDYLDNIMSPAYQSGAVFLLGEHYLIPAVTIQLTPLIGVSIQSIFNLSDSSAFLSVGGEYNIASNAYMDFGYYHFVGDGVTAPPLTVNSEYGASPNTLYLSLRYYF